MNIRDLVTKEYFLFHTYSALPIDQQTDEKFSQYKKIYEECNVGIELVPFGHTWWMDSHKINGMMKQIHCWSEPNEQRLISICKDAVSEFSAII